MLGRILMLLVILGGGYWLYRNPTKPADTKLRWFCWGVLGLFALVWLGWAFGVWPEVALP